MRCWKQAMDCPVISHSEAGLGLFCYSMLIHIVSYKTKWTFSFSSCSDEWRALGVRSECMGTMIRCVVWGRNKIKQHCNTWTWDYAYTDRIHVWYIYPLTYHENQPNVGKYTSPVDPMGYNSIPRIFINQPLVDKTILTLFQLWDSQYHHAVNALSLTKTDVTLQELHWSFGQKLNPLNMLFFELKLHIVGACVLHRSTRTKCTQPNKGPFAIHIFVNKYLAGHAIKMPLRWIQLKRWPNPP